MLICLEHWKPLDKLDYQVTLSIRSFFPISSWKKGFLPGKNPFLPMGREEIPFNHEETQPRTKQVILNSIFHKEYSTHYSIKPKNKIIISEGHKQVDLEPHLTYHGYTCIHGHLTCSTINCHHIEQT